VTTVAEARKKAEELSAKAATLRTQIEEDEKQLEQVFAQFSTQC
jgi:chaperonin cofactor prefoldin